MVRGLHRVGHVVVMDKCFTSLEYFENVFEKDTGATEMFQSSQLGLPKCLINKKRNEKSV